MVDDQLHPTSMRPTPTRQRTGTHALRHMLTRKDFRRLLSARLAAQWADGIFQASLAGAVLFNPQHASNPTDLAASFSVLLLPYSVIGPFAGVLLDRNSRTRLMVFANVLRAVLVLCVAALIFSGVQGWPFYVLTLITVSVSRFFLSALSASLPHVVAQDELVTANALTTTAGTVVSIFGGITAIAIRWLTGEGNHGYGAVAAGAAIGYLVSTWAISHFKADELGPNDEDRAVRTSAREIVSGMWRGAVHLQQKRPAAALLSALAIHRFLFGTCTVALLLLFRGYVHPDGLLRSGLAGLGQALGAGGAGALLAALVTPVITRRIGKPLWAALSLGVGGVVAMLLFTPFIPWLFLLAALILGFAGQASKVCADTVVQETMEESFRGRVFTVYDTMFNVAFVLGVSIAAYTLPANGKSVLMFVLAAAAYAVIAGGYYLASRRGNYPR